MGRGLGLLVIFAVGMALTVLLTVAWMLLLTYGKKKLDDMDGDDWDIYFREIPIWGYVVRGVIYLMLALWVSVPMVYAALRLFRYENCGGLTALFTVLAVLPIVFRTIRKRKDLLDKLNSMKNPH